MPIPFIRFSAVRIENGFVLFLCRKRHIILPMALKPFVKFITVEHISLSGFGRRHLTLNEFIVKSRQRNSKILGSFGNRHGFMQVFTLRFFFFEKVGHHLSGLADLIQNFCHHRRKIIEGDGFFLITVLFNYISSVLSLADKNFVIRIIFAAKQLNDMTMSSLIMCNL